MVNLQGVYLFDSEGNIFLSAPVGRFDKLSPGQESFTSVWVAESEDNGKAVLPPELEDGYYLIAVVSSITERKD